MRECSKKWYQKNREKRKEHRENNKDKIREYDKEWKKNNPNYMKKYLKVYNKKSEVKEKNKEYQQKPKTKIRMKEYRQKKVGEENKRRKKLGLPLVGEGYISECEMFRILKKIIKSPMIKHDRTVLDGLELDAYFSKLKLAFEYMGKQHYEWIKFFHPTEAEFKAQQYRDKCTKKICKILSITLIVIKYDEELSEQLVLSKLKYFKFPIINRRFT